MNERNHKTFICLNADGIEETDQFLTCNRFNNFFSTTAQKIVGKIVKTNKIFLDFLTELLQSNFFLTPTLSHKIQEIIKSLNNKKTTGHNSTPTNLLKMFGKMTSILLANLINLSFKCRIFLMSLNIASATPIHKKGDSLDCNNSKRLYNLLGIHELFYEHQYGFQKKHSTNHAPIDITEKVRSALDQNIFACSIFIEKKAFDTVNHDILLHKLDHNEIRGLPNKRFQSFLLGRSQYTSIKDKGSNKLSITYDVPQG